MDYKILVGDKRIIEIQNSLGSKTWPEFMQHDKTANKYWPYLYNEFLSYQFAISYENQIIGICNSVPINWYKPLNDLPVSAIDWSMKKAFDDFNRNLTTNLIIGIQILIDKKYQNRNISYEMIEVLKKIAVNKQIENIAFPVRPTLKCNYPLIPMEEYLKWQNKNGLPFDPWIRVHIKIGGKIVGICRKSMTISGSVSQWEKWTGLIFQSSGDYIIDKALTPIKIDREKNIGIYIEPNVWIIHNIHQ